MNSQFQIEHREKQCSSNNNLGGNGKNIFTWYRHVQLSNRNGELSYVWDPAQVLQPHFVVASLWVEEEHQSQK